MLRLFLLFILLGIFQAFLIRRLIRNSKATDSIYSGDRSIAHSNALCAVPRLLRGRLMKEGSPPDNSSDDDNNSRLIQLNQRPGSKPLTSKVKKSQQKLRDSSSTEVWNGELSKGENSKKSLSEFKAGQKVRGRITSVLEYGIFIDIGATKSGLMHIKDVSKDYFIQNLAKRFIKGQDVDVWIKFCDPTTEKLGLQMFPPTAMQGATSPRSRFSGTQKLLGTPSEGAAVEGTVMRVSDYGVFVDIGIDVEAFLPKRKMKLTRRQHRYKPWEVHPLGTKVASFVHQSDSIRNRVQLTTYAPSDWDVYLPKYTVVERDSQDEEIASRAGFTQRDTDLDDEYSDEYEEEEEEEDEEGEELTAAEVRALTAGSRYANAQILIDEVAGENSGVIGATSNSGKGEETVLGSSARKKSKPSSADEELLSTEELFSELSRGRTYITTKDLVKWSYLQQFVEDGDIDEEKLAALVSEATPNDPGKIKVGDLDNFLDLLADALGLVDNDGDYIDEEDLMSSGDSEVEGNQIFDDQPALEVLIDHNNFENVIPRSESNVKEDGTYSSRGAGTRADSLVLVDEDEFASSPSPQSLADHFERGSDTNDLFSYVFKTVAGKKGFVEVEDALEWDFTVALLEQGKASKGSVRLLFSRIAEETKCRQIKNDRSKLNKLGFQKFVDELSAIDEENSGASPAVDSVINSIEANDSLIGGRQAGANEAPTEDAVGTVEYDDELYDEISVDDAFADLAGSKGVVTLSAVVSWDLVREMLEDELLSMEQLRQLFQEASGGRAGLNMERFETLVDLLAPFAEGDDDGDEDFNEEEDDNEEEGESEYPSTSVEDASRDGEGDDDNDEEVLRKVFDGLSHGKAFCSVKDLLNWDFVLDLVGEGLLSEESLQSKILAMGGSRKGIDIEGFDRLVDDLVLLYKELESRYDEDDSDGDASSDEDMLSYQDGDVNTDSADYSDGDGEKDFDEDGKDYELNPLEDGEDAADVMEINLDEAFSEASNGKDYVTLEDFKQWQFVDDLRKDGVLDDDDIADIIFKAEVEDPQCMDIFAFEAVLSMLSWRLEEEEGDDE